MIAVLLSSAMVILIADVAEERFTRIKHYSGIPYSSVSYCLKAGSLTMEDIDIVAVSSADPIPELNFLFRHGEWSKGTKNHSRARCRCVSKVFQQR